MCGACGVRPPVDWYDVGVPSDQIGRAASLLRLRALVETALPRRGARVSLTLAGTALLISTPTGASKLVTGVPGAITALETLFGAIPTMIGAGSSSTAREVATPIPKNVGWETIAWWFSAVLASRRDDLVSASALVDTDHGPISLEYANGTTRAERRSADGRQREVRLSFSPTSAAPTPESILRSLEDVMTRSVRTAPVD
jgi:hypothetical protein